MSVTHVDARRRAAPPEGTRSPPDPLGEDYPSDFTACWTDRAVVRVALVAVELGRRAARGGVEDPIAWLTASRPSLAGRSWLEASAARGDCVAAVLLHTLDLPLDIDRDELDVVLGLPAPMPGPSMRRGGTRATRRGGVARAATRVAA